MRSGRVLTRQIGLPGGVTVTVTGAGSTWAYPSLVGHTLVTVNGTTTAGGVGLYDPYGQPLHPVTLAIGTPPADAGGTTAGNTGGCGPNGAAGASGNRTSLTDVWTAPGQSPVTTSTGSCYDWADRLLSTTVTGPVVGANTVTYGLAHADIGYDARGNTTKLADMTFT